jgi:hypothetical protein
MAVEFVAKVKSKNEQIKMIDRGCCAVNVHMHHYSFANGWSIVITFLITISMMIILEKMMN